MLLLMESFRSSKREGWGTLQVWEGLQGQAERGPSDGFKQGRDGVRFALKDINVVTSLQEREVIISAFQRESS